VRELLRAPATVSLQHGTLVHRLVQEVEWLEHFAASDPDLDARIAALEPDATLRARAIEAFREAIRRPAVAALLSRTDAGNGARTNDGSDGLEREVVRERRFSVELPERDGTTALWSGAVDRLVLGARDGRVVAADVIDFKSDRLTPAEVADRVAHYRPQMEAYRRVVSAQTGLDEDAIRAILVFLTPGVVAIC
jgi:ATP-dependent exoDNAse (exonuclease V) beta subunit